MQHLAPLDSLLDSTLPNSDNKEVKKKQKELRIELSGCLNQKLQLLKYVFAEGFYTVTYLKKKAILSLNDSVEKKAIRLSKEKTERIEKISVPTDVLHPEFYRKLVNWRNAKAAVLKLPVYTVIQQKAMLGICNLLPTDKRMLATIPYLGQRGIEKYGEEILQLVKEYKNDNNYK